MQIRKDRFPQMSMIIPKGKSGEFSIEKKRITKDEAKRSRIRAIWHPDEIPYKEGTIIVLGKKSDRSWKDKEVMMSDTEFERRTNQDLLRIANGNILIAGLGIGMVILPLLKNKDVKKITVIEKEQDIINLVYKHIKKFDKTNKLEVIHDDILTIDFSKERKFDIIYFDIWDNVCGDNYKQMKELKKKFRKNRTRFSTMRCWEEEKTKELDRE